MTMPGIVDRAIAAAGLDRWLARRLQGEGSRDDSALVDRICGDLDVLVLGAIADRVRAHERGDVVRVHVDRPPAPPGDPPGVCTIDTADSGYAFVRRVAHARLSAPPSRTVRIDAEKTGLPVAQVGLAFGADELIAPVRRLALEVYTETDVGAHERAILREREIAGLVRCARRLPIIVEWRGRERIERPVDETSSARRRFRAPGRDVRPEGDV